MRPATPTLPTPSWALVPSALTGLTAVFGMGTGVTLWKEPPELRDLIDLFILSIFVSLLDCIDDVPNLVRLDDLIFVARPKLA